MASGNVTEHEPWISVTLLRLMNQMKKILLVAFASVIHLAALAEYSGYQLTLEVEYTDGSVAVGYAFPIGAYFNLDSINDTDYLKRQLTIRDGVTTDSLGYFKTRLVYDAVYPDDPSNANRYYDLQDFTKVALNQVARIKVRDRFNYSYLSQISSGLTLADSTWSNQKCVDSFVAGAYLCDFQIFVHEDHPEIQKIKAELNAHWDSVKGLDLDYDTGDEADSEVAEIVAKLYEYKVVVIMTCTC